jgi:quercetin dioxygenase-like cupin family protein
VAEFEEKIMEEMARRTVFALGLAAAAMPALASSKAAMAQPYGPDEGKELAPGVRLVELGKGQAIIPGYKTVSMIDVVFQPGSNLPNETMQNDMVCHVTDGALRIVQNGTEFRAEKNHVWTCAKGTEEQAWNEGEEVAVMRVTDLLPE